MPGRCRARAHLLRRGLRLSFPPDARPFHTFRVSLPPTFTVRVATELGESLLAAVRETLTRSHVILGDIGRDSMGRWALLVRTYDDGQLEIALLKNGTEAGTNELTLHRRLDATIPATDILCPFCDRMLRVWGRHCTRCGRDLSGPVAESLGLTEQELRDLIRDSAGETYEFLGSIQHSDDGGAVYFARETASRRIVALPVETSSEGTGEQPSSVGISGHLLPIREPTFPFVPPFMDSAPDIPAPIGAMGDVLEAFRAQSDGEYEIFGEMGRERGMLYFLARELATLDLVVLRLAPATGGFVRDLDRRVLPRTGTDRSTCAGCGARLDGATDKCPQCARMISTTGRTATERAEEQVRLREMSAATDGEYDFISEIDASNPASSTYFARRLRDDTVVGIIRERSRSFGREEAFSIREMDARQILDERPTPAESPPLQPERKAQELDANAHAPEHPSPPREEWVSPPRSLVIPETDERRWLVPAIIVALVVVVLLVTIINSFG